MIYNAISAKSITAKVYRDLNVEDPSYELDMIEWMGEALDWIGAGVSSVDRESWIVVTNHTAHLPSDLEVLKGVWLVNDAPLKNDWENEEFPYDLSQVQDLRKYKLERTDQQLHDGIGGPSTDLPESTTYGKLDNWRTNFRDFDTQNDDIKQSNQVETDYQESYHLNGNHVKTSFNSGLLLIAYKGFPLDEDGYPLIPDDVAFKEALFWYIAKKIALGGKQLPFDFQMADQMWNKRCTQARNRAKFPDLDEYENFLQSWTKMVETERFNESTMYHEHQDTRGNQIESGDYDPGNYRITEDGVYRITN